MSWAATNQLPSPAATPANSAYALGQSPAESHRLHLLNAVYGEASQSLLTATGLTAGWNCLDVGCGTGLITHWLAEQTGPTGVVLGIDISESFLDQARTLAEQHEMRHARFAFSDASAQDLGAASFDLVYARCLLSHLPQPSRVLHRMVALTKPGGVICIEDIDCGTGLPTTLSPAHQRYWQLYRAVISHHGGDPSLGRKLPRLFHQSGLIPAHVGVVSPTKPASETHRLYPLTLSSLRPAITRSRLATDSEVDDLIAQLHSTQVHAAACPMVQVWARKSTA